METGTIIGIVGAGLAATSLLFALFRTKASADLSERVGLVENDLIWIKTYLLKDAVITLTKPNPGLLGVELAKKIIDDEPLNEVETRTLIENLTEIAETTETARERLRAGVALRFIGDYLESVTNESRQRRR